MSRTTVLIAATSALLLSACATKDFVKETVAPVQSSVDSLGTRVQANDDGLKALGGRVQGSETRIQALEREAAERAQAAKNLPAPPGLLMSTVLTDDKIKFTSGRAELTDAAGRDVVALYVCASLGATGAADEQSGRLLRALVSTRSDGIAAHVLAMQARSRSNPIAACYRLRLATAIPACDHKCDGHPVTSSPCHGHLCTSPPAMVRVCR